MVGILYIHKVTSGSVAITSETRKYRNTDSFKNFGLVKIWKTNEFPTIAIIVKTVDTICVKYLSIIFNIIFLILLNNNFKNLFQMVL